MQILKEAEINREDWISSDWSPEILKAFRGLGCPLFSLVAFTAGNKPR